MLSIAFLGREVSVFWQGLLIFLFCFSVYEGQGMGHGNGVICFLVLSAPLRCGEFHPLLCFHFRLISPSFHRVSIVDDPALHCLTIGNMFCSLQCSFPFGAMKILYLAILVLPEPTRGHFLFLCTCNFQFRLFVLG